MKHVNRIFTILIFIFLYIPMAVLIVASFNVGKDITEFEGFTLMQYADHHNFTSEELSVIARRFSELSSADKLIVTTEKDAERLMGRDDIPAIIKDNICALPIKVKIIDEENKFNQIIKDYVRENTGDRSIPAVGDED